MRNKKNLAQLSKHISKELIETMHLLDALQELGDRSGKTDTILAIIYNKTKSAFHANEKSRHLISNFD